MFEISFKKMIKKNIISHLLPICYGTDLLTYMLKIKQLSINNHT